MKTETKIWIIHEDYLQMAREVQRPDDMEQHIYEQQFEMLIKGCDEIKHLKETHLKEPTPETIKEINNLWEFHKLYLETRILEDSALMKGHQIRLETAKIKEQL